MRSAAVDVVTRVLLVGFMLLGLLGTTSCELLARPAPSPDSVTASDGNGRAHRSKRAHNDDVTPPSAQESAAPSTSSPPTALPGLARIADDSERTSVSHVVQAIEHHGPFPYERDGIDFHNAEGLLPKHARGYYHEYTVPTPGASTRGARRVIAGDAGELYYTRDHYRKFLRLDDGRAP